MNKVSLSCNKNIHTLVDPCENQGESKLVCELPTTSKDVKNNQLGDDDLDVLECLDNPISVYSCEVGFDCAPFAVHNGLCLFRDYSLERESVACLEMLSTPSSCVFYIELANNNKLKISKYLHEDTIVGVDSCDTFPCPICSHDIFLSDIKGMPNFEGGTLGESKYGRKPWPWLLLSFDPGTILGWKRITLGLFSFCLDACPSHLLCSICTNLFMIKTKYLWIYFKFVPPRYDMLMCCCFANPNPSCHEDVFLFVFS